MPNLPTAPALQPSQVRGEFGHVSRTGYCENCSRSGVGLYPPCRPVLRPRNTHTARDCIPDHVRTEPAGHLACPGRPAQTARDESRHGDRRVRSGWTRRHSRRTGPFDRGRVARLSIDHTDEAVGSAPKSPSTGIFGRRAENGRTLTEGGGVKGQQTRGRSGSRSASKSSPHHKRRSSRYLPGLCAQRSPWPPLASS